MALINAYRKDTGEKVRVPEHWLKHPTLGEPFSKTPQQKAAERAASTGEAKTSAPKEK